MALETISTRNMFVVVSQLTYVDITAIRSWDRHVSDSKETTISIANRKEQ